MPEKVRLASIGLGWWGGVLAEAAEQSGEIDITACFARSEETRRAFGEKFSCYAADDLEQILKDTEIDGLLTATPHSHHKELIAQAATAGKHIFVEKPFTLTVEAARESIHLAEEAGIVLQVGHHRRRSEANRRIRALLDENTLGVVHQLEASFSNYKLWPPNWRGSPEEQPLGGLTGLGVHMIDTFHYFVGPIKRVFCISKKIRGLQSVDEATVVALEFESGPLGQLSFSFSIPKTCNVGVFGDEASAWSEEDGAKIFFQRTSELSRSELTLEANDPIADQVVEFAKAIRGEVQPETGGPEGLAVVEVMEALIESNAIGKPVLVSDFR